MLRIKIKLNFFVIINVTNFICTVIQFYNLIILNIKISIHLEIIYNLLIVKNRIITQNFRKFYSVKELSIVGKIAKIDE